MYFIAAIILMLFNVQTHWVIINAEKGLRLITCAHLIDCVDDIALVEQDDWYEGQDASSDSEGVWLTPDPRAVTTKKQRNIGKITLKRKVRLKYGRQHGLISFTTSFVFQIFSMNPFPNSGSGLVFFIANYSKAPYMSYGRYFGLVSRDAPNSSTFFAVEFDTHDTSEFHDPSPSHIGIDVNSLVSRTTVESNASFNPELYLYNNKFRFTAWIEYDAHRKLTQVWMTNSTSFSTQRPRSLDPILNLTYDLSTVFEDDMYVGFAASNNNSEDGMEGHVLYAWNFTTYPPSIFKLLLDVIVPLLTTFALVCVIYCIIFFFYIRRKKRHIVKPVYPHYMIGSSIRGGYNRLLSLDSSHRYRYKELKKATLRFADINKIGEGAFSTVYKGRLSDGEIVAVKRLKEGFRKEVEFTSELEIISKLRHRNLLPLLGWCYDKGEALLVYRYMSKGSLSNYLYGEHKGTLSSEVRLNILIGVASALEYLHGNLQVCVLHRDIKPGNVLLTDNFEPILCDFGLARFIGHSDDSVTMTAVGTPGYVAPEVVYTNKTTEKSDVYSFGVLGLVVASGRPAIVRSTSAMFQSEEVRLVDFIWMLHQSNQLMEALDLTMCIGLPDEEMERWGRVLHVALMCSNPSPELRPTMRQVCQALQGDNFLLMNPLPATRPMYSWPPNRPSASEGGGLSSSAIESQGSTSISTTTFDPSTEKWVGR